MELMFDQVYQFGRIAARDGKKKNITRSILAIGAAKLWLFSLST